MTMIAHETTQATTPRWRGINHLALITTDMDATVRFYHQTLGARLVSTVATPKFRHYFFELGPGCTIAFFEYAGAAIEPLTKPAGVPDRRAIQFDHVALNLADEEALIELQHRLKAADCDVTDIIDHGAVRSVYFTDPNGIALEASWWVHDPTAHAADYNDAGAFGDYDPVPAVRELKANGRLSKTPSTRLA